MFKDDLLKGKRILVTGGGSGLGKEMSRYFLKYGAEVLICGRRVSVLEDTAKKIRLTMEHMDSMREDMQAGIHTKTTVLEMTHHEAVKFFK